MEITTPLGEPIIEWIIFGCFAIATLFSIIHFFRKFKLSKIKASIPVLIQLVTMLMILFIPFTNIVMNMDFRQNYEQRLEVVSLIESGKLNDTDDNGLITLPKKYHHLSRGGEVLIARTDSDIEILFYTFRGVLDRFSGFLYTTKNMDLESRDDLKQIQNIKDHWYWISSY